MRQGQIQSPEACYFFQVDNNDLINTLHKDCSTHDESTLTFISPSYLQAYYERLECSAERKLYRIILFSYAPRTITDIFCSQVHTPVRKFSSKFSDVASLGVLYIVFIQRHRYPLTPRFYWVPSNIFSVMDDSSSLYVDLWAGKPFHFLASMAYGNFLLGEEMIVPACEDYGLCRGWEQVTWLLVEGILLERPVCSPCFSPWSIIYICSFPNSPSASHFREIKTPLFTGKDWGSVNCNFLLVHGVFFWWRIGCSRTLVML